MKRYEALDIELRQVNKNLEGICFQVAPHSSNNAQLQVNVIYFVSRSMRL